MSTWYTAVLKSLSMMAGTFRWLGYLGGDPNVKIMSLAFIYWTRFLGEILASLVLWQRLGGIGLILLTDTILLAV